jgi:hypothetical protein
MGFQVGQLLLHVGREWIQPGWQQITAVALCVTSVMPFLSGYLSLCLERNSVTAINKRVLVVYETHRAGLVFQNLNISDLFVSCIWLLRNADRRCLYSL